MAHFSSKPCVSGNCCGRAEFVEYGCSLAYRVFADVWVQIKDSLGNVIVGPYFQQASTALYLAATTADQYTIEIRLSTTGTWSIADSIDWTPDTSNSGCCIETVANDWYDLDELDVSLDAVFQFVEDSGATVPQTHLGSYAVPYARTLGDGRKVFEYIDAVGPDPLDILSIVIYVSSSGAFEFFVQRTTPSGLGGVDFYVRQGAIPNCSLYTNGQLYWTLSGVVVIAYREFTIEGRKYIASEYNPASLPALRLGA